MLALVSPVNEMGEDGVIVIRSEHRAFNTANLLSCVLSPGLQPFFPACLVDGGGSGIILTSPAVGRCNNREMYQGTLRSM